MVNYLLSHRFAWGTTEELGVHTLTVVSPETDPAIVAEAASAAFAAAWVSSVGGPQQFSGQAVYNRVSAARIANLSTGQLDAAAHNTVSIPMTGSSSSPPQLAVAVSLTAGSRPNGSPLRGRMYLPSPSEAATGSVGTLVPTAMDFLVTLVEDWLANLADGEMAPGVWSRSLGVIQPLTSARIGNVVDTIRSRRNQIPEVYSPVPVP